MEKGFFIFPLLLCFFMNIQSDAAPVEQDELNAILEKWKRDIMKSAFNQFEGRLN